MKRSGVDFKFKGKSMTFPTADMGFCHVSFGFFTVGGDLNTPLKKCVDRPADRRVQLEKFTGIGAADPWYRAGTAKIARPAFACGFQQTTFLHVPIYNGN
jgi:hypothetical protein